MSDRKHIVWIFFSVVWNIPLFLVATNREKKIEQKNNIA